MTNWKRLLGILMALGLLVAACTSTGDDDDSAQPAATAEATPASAAAETADAAETPDEAETADAAETPEATPGAEETSTAAADDEPVDTGPEFVSVDARGVTDETISIGVTIVDFEALAALGVAQMSWGDQEDIWQTLIDATNASGGIHGRQLVATFAPYNPVVQASAEAACVELTEDIEVFAVLGGFTGPVSSANVCFSQSGVAQFGISPDPDLAREVPWVATDAAEERRMVLLGSLLIKRGLLEGKKFGIVGFEDRKAAIDANLIPYLAETGLEPTRAFYTRVRDGDIQALNAETDVWIERIRADGLEHLIFIDDAVGLIGDLIKRGYEGQSSVDWAITLSAEEGVPAEAFDGVISVADNEEAGWDAPGIKECRDIFEAARPDLAPLPAPIDVLDSEDVDNWPTGLQWACEYFQLFVAVMNASETPTNEAVMDAIANNLGSFSFGSSPYASLGPDKFDANDSFYEAEWDHTIGAQGAWNPSSELLDLG